MINKYNMLYKAKKMHKPKEVVEPHDNTPSIELKDNSILLSEKEVKYIGELVVAHDLNNFIKRDSRLLFPAIEILVDNLHLNKEYNKDFKIK